MSQTLKELVVAMGCQNGLLVAMEYQPDCGGKWGNFDVITQMLTVCDKEQRMKLALGFLDLVFRALEPRSPISRTVGSIFGETVFFNATSQYILGRGPFLVRNPDRTQLGIFFNCFGSCIAEPRRLLPSSGGGAFLWVEGDPKEVEEYYDALKRCYAWSAVDMELFTEWDHPARGGYRPTEVWRRDHRLESLLLVRGFSIECLVMPIQFIAEL